MALGALSSLSPYALVAWFYLVLLTSFPRALSGGLDERRVHILYMLCYLPPMELLGRMAKTSPLIPYELGKYLTFFLCVLGIISAKPRSLTGFFLLLLLSPAFFYDFSNKVVFKDLVFNLIGSINVALIIWLLKDIPVWEAKFINALKLAIYPLVMVLGFSLIKTPDYDEIEFSLGANFDISGGFGSNQVSTALGTACFLLFLFWLNRWRFSGYRWLDAALLFIFAFQGLLTFSRGGMLGGALGIVLIIYFISKASNSKKRIYGLPIIGRYLLPASIVFIGAFIVANSITGGNLLMRYQGETAGTLAGTKEKDLNTLTTGRFDIFTGDLLLWADNPLTGVGAGASKYLRPTHTGSLTHVELSRLLAEHGAPGFLFFGVLLVLGFSLINSNQNNPMFKYICIALFLIGVYTTFHAAMRTYLSPLFIGLSMMYIYRDTTNSGR